jgi:hypothetical protein
VPTAPYPTLEKILGFARVQVNDAIQANGGNTLVDSADFTPLYVNRAWLMLQQELVSNGFDRFRTDNLIVTLPAVNSEDTALQVTLDWTGYYDGVSLNTGVVLPQTLIKALKLSERPTDSAPNVNSFIDMDGPEQGIRRIPSITKQQWNGIWVWDDDQVRMPGATAQTDVHIDFLAYLPDFTGSGAGFPGPQTANILRCEDAFAGFIAAVFCAARGDVDASTTLQQAKDAAKILAGAQPTETPMAAVQ